MGGTPSGIETLVPRVKAKIGFPGFEFLEPGLQNELRTQMKPPSGIGLKRGSRGARLLTQLRPFSIPGLKTIGALAAPFAPTGIMAFLNRAKTDKELDYIRSLNEEFGLSGEAMDPDRIAEIDKERKRLSEEGNEISFADNFKIDIKKAPEYILKAIGTKVLPGETALEAVLREGKVLAEKRADKKDVPTSKDTQPGGDVKEDSFETEYDKQYKRVEKYLGKDVDKGEIAIALSDAIGTPGTLADKAAVLNKFLLRKSAGMKKDKRDMAKLAYAATVDLEKAQIAAGKKSQTEKLIDRARVLSAKKERTTDEDLELKLTRSALGDNKKLANLNQVLAAGKDVRKDITNYKEQLSVIEKLEGGAKEQAQNTANSTKQDILSTIQILKSYGVDDATLRGLFGDDLKLFLAEGGRVEMAMGGATEASANPIDTKLTFEQLRTRLPKEITDDIVRLVANSEEALQDFAYIRTQGDVEKFNVKYGVNLVLPQNTA
jgi:hypothetical protein